jgi:AraC-like DNA-binding protein
VLERDDLLESPMLSLAAVRCPGGRAWSHEEPVTTAAVVLVRNGIFLRRVNGRRTIADPTTGYVQHPGDVQQVSHPAGSDVCTTIGIPPEWATHLPVSAPGPVTVTAAADLAHRRLLAAARAGHRQLPDLAADVLATLLPVPGPAAAGRVDDARTALHTDPELPLAALAALSGWSPWHLSRAFHRATGLTISTYRRRLRVRAALDALTTDEPLAAIAARTGFADQAHMTRTLRREIDLSPATARRLLRDPVDHR